MTIEDLYRVMCGNDRMHIRRASDTKVIFSGRPDDIPMSLMDARIRVLTAVSGKIEAWIEDEERR